ncbi:class I SAM-dependent methyltransferase [Gelidibacter maritimus]|uniref:Class I SAM-dependent methyltransferase n=1 Tax=Gelidibacter maritimus TaxID=2761487 RepID=A0A7W2R3C5_9FLAO|nr:class I SAM-dependent methyltransferase [Gelidibacter maritimus]MBA6152697.1 class I SAM-dependent methyltransferase [Gelidibacter maritimus]
MRESLEFYNQFEGRLIKDYVLGNKRVIGAIKNLGQFIPKNSQKILDIGCGIGWSSYEFAKSFPNSQVNAIDLSPVLIETASKLFDDKKNLIFKTYDLTDGLPKDTYDVIVMIDVYEHIPLSERFEFHKSIKKNLNNRGRLVLACPSKYHQAYIKEHNPSGIQPIDEDVDFETINQIAKDIDGEVILFEYQNIWRNYDYLYAVIEINPEYGSSDKMIKYSPLILESKKERELRVESKLGIKLEQEKKTNKTSTRELILKYIKKKKG